MPMPCIIFILCWSISGFCNIPITSGLYNISFIPGLFSNICLSIGFILRTDSNIWSFWSNPWIIFCTLGLLRCYIKPATFWLGARVPGGPAAIGKGWKGYCWDVAIEDVDTPPALAAVVGVVDYPPPPGLDAFTRWIVWSFYTL